MTDLRKAAQEAAKVLANALSIDFNDKRDWYSYKHDVEYATNLLLQALAQEEQQFKYTPYGLRADENGTLSIGEIPQRNWIGLTDYEIMQALDKANLPTQFSYRMAGKVIEAKLKELNA